MAETLIRNARIGEAALLTKIAARSKAHWPYDQAYLDLCNQVTQVDEDDISHWHFVVAEVEGRVAGFVGVAPVKDEFMLDHLWIEPEFIGKGIGQTLFKDAVLRARTMGWTSFLIVADPYSEEFYLKMGATRVGERESKVRPGFFLPLLRYDLGLRLIGDASVKEIPVFEIGESIVDLATEFPELKFDFDRHNVQKDSTSISHARRKVGEKLISAQNLLPSGTRLLIKECHRPMAVQKSFWDGYSSHLRQKYPDWSGAQVYDECSKLNAPLEVAPHTTGGAVDLTLMDHDGRIFDMGTEFNASPLSTHEATYTIAQNITSEAKKNRRTLMSAMSKAGFINYPTEWWHWSYGDKYWALITEAKGALYSSKEID